jgi:hypothetical protein
MNYFASGDAPFFFAEQIKNLSWLPPVWDASQGFGENLLVRLWIDYPFRLIVKLLSSVGLSWFIIEKLLWLSVFVLAIYSSYRLGKYILGKGPAAIFTPVIYVANTYMLLLFAGGQLGVAFAYGFAPLVLCKFIETIDGQNKLDFRRTVINGLFLALLGVFDLRIGYLIIAAIVLYLVLKKKFSSFYTFVISVLVAGSAHLFWILPTVLTGTGPGTLGQDFINPDMLKFLSVADFSHALSLLHPNWPENLFGKVYFLQPEFLVIPVLAFASLLFLKQITDNRYRITFFALLALIGSFFAKGVNDPFGGVFQWMFIHVPGFVMFRDPTKFYLFTAIGYSILIPFTLERFKKKMLYIIFIIFWVFSIRAVFSGQVKGNFKPMQIPAEYVQLKNLLVADSVPSRTLWIPQKNTFAYYSDIHPIMTATSSVSIDTGVKYVIVPTDVYKRIYLTDYKFDPSIRTKLIDQLSQSLIRNPSFHDLAVFENPDFTGMHTTIPATVADAQHFANIGTGLSAVFLIFWLIWIYLV